MLDVIKREKLTIERRGVPGERLPPAAIFNCESSLTTARPLFKGRFSIPERSGNGVALESVSLSRCLL